MVKYPDPKSMVVDWSGAVNKGITDGIDLGLKIRNSREHTRLVEAEIKQIEAETQALKVKNEELLFRESDKFNRRIAENSDSMKGAPKKTLAEITADLPAIPDVTRTPIRNTASEVTRDSGKYLGQLTANKYDPNSVDNPYGKGNQYDSDSVKNPYGQYGSPYSTKSVNNPYATEAPKLYDSGGNYRGNLSANPNDPDSISNPYGRYGNPYSGDSINNRFGVGNPYNSDSPNNPYGHGLKIIGEK